MRLLTNNPAKRAGLEGYGLSVIGREALPVRPHPENVRYLRTKRDRMGHLTMRRTGSRATTVARKGTVGVMAGSGSRNCPLWTRHGLTLGIVATRWHADLVDHMVRPGPGGGQGVRRGRGERGPGGRLGRAARWWPRRWPAGTTRWSRSAW